MAAGDLDVARCIVKAFGNSDKLCTLFKSPKAVTRWREQAQEISTVNDDNLASIYGVLESEAHKEIDTTLKVMVGAVAGGIKKRKEKGEDLTWDSLMHLLSQSPVLVPREGEIDRYDQHLISRTNWFKSNAQYQDFVPGIQGWLEALIKDPDVLGARSQVDLAAVMSIVTHAGSIMDGISLRYKKERAHVKILDIGFIRYPDITRPYIKVYRIELFAWFSSKTIAGRSADNNGIRGQFNARSYSPNEDCIKKLREDVIEKAVRAAEDCFL